MHFFALALVVLAIAVGPQIWVRAVMKLHARAIPGMPGTGGELAEHLLAQAGLDDVSVERTHDWSDHYDGSARAVRLSPANFDGRSLTAVAVAAHEVGHALQHRDNDSWYLRRQRLVPLGITLQRVGVALVSAAPFVILLTRSPALAALCGAGGLLALLSKVAIHGVTLPVELDASFGRALPMIVSGRYVAPGEVTAVRQVLRAAALTYVSAAAMDVSNIARWVLLARGRWI